ncbi:MULTISPECIES: hypothetical protein [Priestia]|uniref:hypothetical protein n=1 Tax=Priestia TaxID=2800373 RepID=UPI0004101C2F|nr:MULTISPECIES: hypothetical protein [Priestia]MCA4154341.1 hypothetical protein [Priestia megaterium]MCG0046437.1 hypothetical protein [Priestia aryabhattai]MDC7779861.1 hypothetical protein [Priestia megaterium]MDN3229298.1 hypothetical protein [Priestia megaterium]MDP1440076.1 hypothetical protein [Priestia megaterium]
MNKNTMIKTLKVISVVSLLALLFIIAYDRSMSTSMIILFSSLIFFVFVLSDFFFDRKPWGLKGLQLYISLMLFIIAIFEMHQVVSSLCVISIMALPKVIEELA